MRTCVLNLVKCGHLRSALVSKMFKCSYLKGWYHVLNIVKCGHLRSELVTWTCLSVVNWNVDLCFEYS